MERLIKIAAVCISLSAVILLSNSLSTVEGQQRRTPGQGFAAVPGLKGGHDVFGPYDPVANWPRPMEREPSRPSGVDLVAVHRHFSRESRPCLRDAEG